MNTIYKRQRIYSYEICDGLRDGLAIRSKRWYVHGRVMLDRWRPDFKYFETKEAAQKWLDNIRRG